MVLAGGTWAANMNRDYLFNSDYILPPVVAWLLRKRVRPWQVATISAVLLFLLMAVDLFTSYKRVYFTGPALLVDYLPFITLWPWGAVRVPALLIGVMAALIAFAGVPRQGPQKPFWAISAVVLIVLVEMSLKMLPATPLKPGEKNLVSSSTKIIFEPAIAHFGGRLLGGSARATPFPGETMSGLIESQGISSPPRILSISVESLGAKAGSPADQDWAVLARALSPYYQLSSRVHAFEGATLAGELRELCGLKLPAIPYSARDLAQLRNCLPNRLRRSGYATYGYHGGDSWFYNRQVVYEALGLHHRRFFPDLSARVEKPCAYLLVAICDKDLINFAVADLARHERAFVHVMSIDTHLPLATVPPECREADQPQLCTFQTRINDSLRAIGQSIVDARVKPDLILVYGDHGPPFLDRDLLGRYRSGVVPFLEFRRRARN